MIVGGVLFGVGYLLMRSKRVHADLDSTRALGLEPVLPYFTS